MKKFILLSCLGLLFSKGEAQVAVDSIITMGSLKHSISALSHDSMQGRFTGTAGNFNAAVFIAGRFREAGLSLLAGYEDYFQSFEAEGIPAMNVIGGIRGNISPDTIVIFSAHYDHIGIDRNSIDDRIFNGANDNASGIATLIELAKYYKAKKDNRYTIFFVAFGAEEMGLLGSKYLASVINKKWIHAIINFDMLGRPISKNKRKCMVVGEWASMAIKKLNQMLDTEPGFFIRDQYPYDNLMFRMDHISFSHHKNCFSLVTSSARDKYYHRVTDEIQTLDFVFLLETTKNIARACEAYLY